MSTEIYVAAASATARDELGPAASYLSLFHLRADLGDAAAAARDLERTAVTIGSPRIVPVGDGFGYRLEAGAGFRVPWPVLPVTDGFLAPFTLSVGIKPEQLTGADRILTASGGRSDLHAAARNGRLARAGHRRAGLARDRRHVGCAEPRAGTTVPRVGVGRAPAGRPRGAVVHRRPRGVRDAGRAPAAPGGLRRDRRPSAGTTASRRSSTSSACTTGTTPAGPRPIPRCFARRCGGSTATVCCSPTASTACSCPRDSPRGEKPLSAPDGSRSPPRRASSCRRFRARGRLHDRAGAGRRGSARRRTYDSPGRATPGPSWRHGWSPRTGILRLEFASTA